MKKYPVLYFALLVLSIISIFGSNDLQILKSQMASRFIVLPMIETLDYFKTLQHRDAEIDSLKVKLINEKQHNDFLNSEIIKLALELRLKDSYFTQIDSLMNQFNYISAKVISNSYADNNKILVLDKGLLDNIKINDAVVSTEGIVGKVIAVQSTSSTVLPFVNNNSMFSVMNNKNVQGILQTDFNGHVKMSFIEKNSDISPGDTLYTSNLSMIFKDYYTPVGRVESVQLAKNELYLEASIVPFTEVNNLTTVFIIKKNPDE